MSNKVCLVYTDNNGDIQRTRFFHESSKRILERKKAFLQDQGLKPREVKRNKWEMEMGPINNPPSAPSAHRDLRFVAKTTELRQWQYQHEKANGKPLAY